MISDSKKVLKIDNILAITPKYIRLRKIYLTETDRKRFKI